MMRKLLLCGALLIGALAALSGTALADTPAPGFEQFAGCPNTSDVTTCLRADTHGGHLKIGTTDTPINQTQTISGGLHTDGSITYTAQGGFLGNALEVPGGLSGLTGISGIIINILTLGANRVYAKAEIVGTPFFTGDLQVPLKVKLQNPFLVSTCAIGSAADPLTLNLTRGTTAPPPPAMPITGRMAPFGLDPANPAIILFADEKFVDNSFAAPVANGCTLLGFGLINLLVNARVGLPSAAGKNEAILDHTDTRITNKFTVYPPTP